MKNKPILSKVLH